MSGSLSLASMPDQVLNEINRREVTGRVRPALLGIGGAAAGAGAVMAAVHRYRRMRAEQEASERTQLGNQDVQLFKQSASKLAGLLDGIKHIASGGSARRPYHLPTFLPKAVGAAAIGGLGGYAIADKLVLGPLEKKHEENEKEKARREYQEALQQFWQSKQSSERCKLAKDFDRIEAVLSSRGEKMSADYGADLSNVGSTALGVALLGMGGAGAAGLYKGYKDRVRSSPSHAIRQAILERKVRRGVQFHPRIKSLPPVPTVDPAVTEEEESPVSAV